MMPEKAIPQYVCHYTKLETALEHILPEKRLKLSPLGKTNDPRESKPWNLLLPFTIGIQGEERKKQGALVTRALDEIRRVMKEDWKVLYFTMDHSYTDEFDIPRTYTILGYDRPRMWAQYAENHRGVCIQFDGDKLN
jgi:hypothetical protein